MFIYTECEICNSTIKNAVRCLKCQKYFCKSCIEEWINKNKENNQGKSSCPNCRTDNFDYADYPELDDLINSSSMMKCQKCKRIYFKKEEFHSHLIICSQIKCIICHEIFKDNTSFIKHFEQEGRYKEKFLICNYLNANPYNYIQNNINHNNKNEYETPFQDIPLIKRVKYKHPSDLIENEIQIYAFKNNFNPILLSSNHSNFNFNKYNNYKGKLNKDYDIFYCYNDNLVNNKICSPGNELCPVCMKINQEYHKLKKHYLINAAGRVCTYKRKKMYCLCNFQRIIKKENKIFCPDLVCFNNDICKPCQDINNIIHFYFGRNLINKLKKRDEINGY